MGDITKLNFVCAENKNCPVNYDKTGIILDYCDTYAVPDKKNETCCRHCNSILFEENIYIKRKKSEKREKQKKYILLISIIILALILFFYLLVQNNII
jgi:hypothetical protein